MILLYNESSVLAVTGMVGRQVKANRNDMLCAFSVIARLQHLKARQQASASLIVSNPSGISTMTQVTDSLLCKVCTQ